jgi:hypothetical protein
MAPADPQTPTQRSPVSTPQSTISHHQSSDPQSSMPQSAISNPAIANPQWRNLQSAILKHPSSILNRQPGRL